MKIERFSGITVLEMQAYRNVRSAADRNKAAVFDHYLKKYFCGIKHKSISLP